MNNFNTLFRRAAAFAIAAASSIGMMAMPASCWAATDTADVDVLLTLEATAIDITVSDSIRLTGEDESTDLTGNSITVTNNNEIGVIKLDTIAFNEEVGDWKLVGNDTDFAALSWNAKKFSLVSGDHDFASSASMTIDEEIEANGSSEEISFSGKTGASTTAYSDEKIASMIVTVSTVEAE